MAGKKKFKKSLGQVFLKDKNILSEIIASSNLSKDQTILEIGAGAGYLTELLVNEVGRVVALEIDSNWYDDLKIRFKPHKNLTLYNQDFLKFDLSEIFDIEPDIKKRKVIANIPYHLTSSILKILLNEKKIKASGIDNDTPLFSEIYLMVQKEVADRVVGSPGHKNYGALSVFVQYTSKAEILIDVPRACFKPVPKVDSSFIKLTPVTKAPVELNNPDILWTLVRSIFNSRRKTLRNSIKCNPILSSCLDKIGDRVDLTIRGEKLDIHELARISNIIDEIIE